MFYRGCTLHLCPPEATNERLQRVTNGIAVNELLNSFWLYVAQSLAFGYVTVVRNTFPGTWQRASGQIQQDSCRLLQLLVQ